MPPGEAIPAQQSESTRLLAPDEPAPFFEHNGDGASPFLLVCDHAGNRLPKMLGTLGVAAADLTRHVAWDVGIAPTARSLAEALDAPLIMSTYSRLLIDCNRNPEVASSMPKVSEVTTVPGNENITPDEAGVRVREIFAPYHEAIARRLDQRQSAGRTTVLIALHSFTPVFGGIPRPWHCGVLYNRYSDLALALQRLLQDDPQLVVGNNEPYSVTDDTDYTIPVHGERRGIPHVAIEIRHDLIETEAGQQQWAALLARLLPKAAGV